MTSTGNQDFIAGWFLCSAGKPLPHNANKQMQDGYGRCYETEQNLTYMAELKEKEMKL